MWSVIIRSQYRHIDCVESTDTTVFRDPLDIRFHLVGEEEFISMCELDFHVKQVSVRGKRVPLRTVGKKGLLFIKPSRRC
ncbi:hypothetical protein E2C01_054724 [Portunus trituberculatus]|uniref:Uncharacterized protein n=1 Tax=Portunus trituberculatus TaxID=210409 RepID=A0A5B7GUP8_PORTR|nr:hypothetical protein [Portunus trituberculatus]